MNYSPAEFATTLQREEAFKHEFKPILGRQLVDVLIKKGFCTAPASTKYHGSYAGGLFDHSYNVAHVLDTLTVNNKLEWERPESPMIIGILHDLCKIDQYRLNEETNKYEYNNNLLVKGHGIKSVVYIYEMLGMVDLTEEERTCILYHMGAYTPQEEWADYNRAINTFPNVLWTHTADMIASQIMEVQHG